MGQNEIIMIQDNLDRIFVGTENSKKYRKLIIKNIKKSDG